MKKIILVSDSKAFTKSAKHVLNMLQDTEPLFVVGEFLHALNYAELTNSYGQLYTGLIVDLLEQDRDAVDENISLFERHCQSRHIKYRVQEDNCVFDTNQLIIESRFADLLILNEKLSIIDHETGNPTIDIRKLLQKAECPVLFIPEHFTEIKGLAFAYDGKKESMFALKQFCYLFPALSQLPTEIVFLSNQQEEVLPEMACLKEYVHPNFSCMNICKLPLDPVKDLARWAIEKKGVLMIAGSYSRSSSFNTKSDSFIDPILKMQQLPVFITHH